MNTDRELLELAAKAAGLRFAINGDGFAGYISVPSDDWRHGWCRWNPLTNDGDALRLAVKIGITVGHDARYKLSYADFRHKTFYASELYAETSLTAEQATRRVIVRTAAEIGRGLAAKQEQP